MRIRHLAPLLIAILVLALGAAPVLARDGEARGSCSGGPGEYRLQVRPSDGSTLRVRFEIERGEPGQAWQIFLSADGTRIWAGTRTSSDDGKVRVQRSTADRSGRDRIAATAVNLATGGSCAGSVRS